MRVLLFVVRIIVIWFFVSIMLSIAWLFVRYFWMYHKYGNDPTLEEGGRYPHELQDRDQWRR